MCYIVELYCTNKHTLSQVVTQQDGFFWDFTEKQGVKTRLKVSSKKRRTLVV